MLATTHIGVGFRGNIDGCKAKLRWMAWESGQKRGGLMWGKAPGYDP